MPTGMLSRHASRRRLLRPIEALPGTTSRPRLRIAIPLALVLTTLLTRLPGIGRPLLGNFSTKAAVYGMIARSFARGEAQVLYPQLDVLVGGRPSYHLLECPLSAYLTGALWRVTGGELGTWGRATSVFWSVLSVLLLYRLVLAWHGRVAAAGAATALALSPVSIIYGQSFQLEASLVALSLLVLLSLERSLCTGTARWHVVLFFSAAALWLTKIYMLYLLPVLLAVAWPYVRERGCGGRTAPRRAALHALGALAIAIVPTVLWYANMLRAAQPSHEATSRHVYFSMQATRQAHPIPHPLLKNPEFYKGALDDLTGVVLTPVGFGLMLLGAMRRLAWRHVIWLAAAAALVLVAPRKFHEMNYYWLAVLPLLCILVGLGANTVWQAWSQGGGLGASERIPGKVALAAAGAAWLVLSLRYAVVPAFVTPAEDRGVVAAADAVRRSNGPEERIVTVHGTSIALLYYCDRKGWTLEVPPGAPGETSAAVHERLEQYIRHGARSLVVANLEELDGAPDFRNKLDAYPLVEHGKDYAVYRLDQPAGTRISRSGGTADVSAR